MKPHTKIVLACLLTGVALGVAGTRAVVALGSSAPPAYLVAEEDVTDPQAFQNYASKVPPTLAAFGARYFVRGGKTASLEGEPPKRVVIVAFESMEKARAWYDSPAYQAIRPLRLKASKTRAFLIEGTVPPAP
jgi:uncharacterized protein (DUF1330 family)